MNIIANQKTITILVVSAHKLLAEMARVSLEGFAKIKKVDLLLLRNNQLDLTAIPSGTYNLLMLSLGVYTNSFPLISSLHKLYPNVPFLIICSETALPPFEELLNYNVQGFTFTSAELSELETSIYAIAEGTAKSLEQQYTQFIQPKDSFTRKSLNEKKPKY